MSIVRLFKPMEIKISIDNNNQLVYSNIYLMTTLQQYTPSLHTQV